MTYSKKLEDTDLVKSKLNESVFMARKAEANDRQISSIERQTSSKESEKDFDREAFDQLKKELS